MTYIRKTRDVYEVQGYYVAGYGWECVCSEDTRRDAMQRLREYRENEPQYSHRLVMKREPLTDSFSHRGGSGFCAKCGGECLYDDAGDFR